MENGLTTLRDRLRVGSSEAEAVSSESDAVVTAIGGTALAPRCRAFPLRLCGVRCPGQGSSASAFLSSARSSSRSCAAITCTNEPLRVTATQAEPGFKCSISQLWPYSWNNPASSPEPPDPAASWRSLTSCSVLPRSHQTRLRHDHLSRLEWPARCVPAHCVGVNDARGRACGAAHPPCDSFPGPRRQPRACMDVICVPGSRPAAGPDAGPRGGRPIPHDASGTVHLQV